MKLDIVDCLPHTLRNNAIAQNVDKGQRLFHKGDRADYLYLIRQGRFQEVSYPEDNKMVVLQILNTGETLGETSLFYDTYHSSAIAKTNSQVIAYPKSIVLKSLEHSPLVIEATLEILSQKISELQMRLEWRNISITDLRILEYLRYNLGKLSEDAGVSKTVTLKAPLQEIAAELGFVPGALSRALAKLEIEQMITSDNNRITLHDTISKPKFSQYSGGLSKYKLKQAIDYIDTHLDENIKVFDLANLANISQYYFCHLFKQSTGISPYQYIIQQRVAKAKKLLKQRKLSLVEVALECGFSSQSQMTQHFRRCVGLTPNVYRNLE